MAEQHEGGMWPYRGFTVHYRRLANREVTLGPDAYWGVEVVDAPEIPKMIGTTYASVCAAAEQAIDALLAQGDRVPPAPRPQTLRGRYHRITTCLAARPATERAVVLSFGALEELLGGPLPKTARMVASYWTTSSPGRDQGWNAAGWEARLYAGEGVVVFSRNAT